MDPRDFSPDADPDGVRRRKHWRTPPGKKLKLTRAKVLALAEWLRKRDELGTRAQKAAELGISKYTLEHYVARIRAGDLRGREDTPRRHERV